MLYYESAFAITPSDVTVFMSSRILYVGGAGDLKVTMAGGAAAVVTFKNVPAGTLLPLSVVQVLATGTTASSVVGLR